MFMRYRFLIAVLICGLLATAVAVFSVFPTADARPYRAACTHHPSHC
jgi:hypothetical protein